MRYQSLDQVSGRAEVTPAPALTREDRLKRWADLLEARGSRPLRLLTRVEFVPRDERGGLREDDSPVAVAFADPTLREAGLAGDTFGDAAAFFELSQAEAHELLCDCHYMGPINGFAAAQRVRAMARNPRGGALAGLFRFG